MGAIMGYGTHLKRSPRFCVASLAHSCTTRGSRLTTRVVEPVLPEGSGLVGFRGYVESRG